VLFTHVRGSPVADEQLVATDFCVKIPTHDEVGAFGTDRALEGKRAQSTRDILQCCFEQLVRFTIIGEVGATNDDVVSVMHEAGGSPPEATRTGNKVRGNATM
jgi:hypothetical protein